MSIATTARKLARLLTNFNDRIVFAESCTGGFASAALTRVPGISAHHCGGMVTYRNETKQEYLGIDPATLKRPGAVSEKVARQMAERVLERTPEATISVAVTGHLGPHAPERLDGVVFVAVRLREAFAAQNGGESTIVRRLKLPNLGRDARQRLAVEAVLQLAVETLERKAIKGTR